MQRKNKGFSLIELLIVVAIILIIAAIAIPNLLRSRIAANEASAVGSLRTLNTASVTYSTACGGFAPTLLALGPPLAACATADLIDAVLAAGTKSGYNFVYAAGAAVGVPPVIPTYTINANPVTVGTTGQRFFFTDQSGVVRADPAAAATVASTPI
jgi:prepilin-type N-terminal cleavage/methylation domain-containing protein